MIIFRYIARELIITLAAVTTVLLLIVMSGRFIRYLANAASGMFEPLVLLEIMAYRMPGFLQLILPLGLFLGILLGLGRMYVDNELTVLTMAGVSQKQILAFCLKVAFLIAFLAASLSLYLVPQGEKQVVALLNQQDTLTEFDTLTAGRFLTNERTGRVTYVEELQNERTKLKGVFISSSSNGQDSILIAQSGYQQLAADGTRYLVLQNGTKYDGKLGSNDYLVTEFGSYGLMIARMPVKASNALEATSTLELLQIPTKKAQVELYWRFSLPLLVLIVTLIAVPLAKVNPRQGRFVKLLPAVLLYLAYLSILISVRGSLPKNELNPLLGFGLVHGSFLLIGVVLLRFRAN